VILPVAILMAAVDLLGVPEEKGPPAWVAYGPEKTVFQRIPLCGFLYQLSEVPEGSEPA